MNWKVMLRKPVAGKKQWRVLRQKLAETAPRAGRRFAPALFPKASALGYILSPLAGLSFLNSAARSVGLRM
jgi:hypothetical protein